MDSGSFSDIESFHNGLFQYFFTALSVNYDSETLKCGNLLSAQIATWPEALLQYVQISHVVTKCYSINFFILKLFMCNVNSSVFKAGSAVIGLSHCSIPVHVNTFVFSFSVMSLYFL